VINATVLAQFTNDQPISVEFPGFPETDIVRYMNVSAVGNSLRLQIACLNPGVFIQVFPLLGLNNDFGGELRVKVSPNRTEPSSQGQTVTIARASGCDGSKNGC
jgi:hypothetical protein